MAPLLAIVVFKSTNVHNLISIATSLEQSIMTHNIFLNENIFNMSLQLGSF